MPRPTPNDKRTKRLVSKLTRLQANGSGKRTTEWEKTFLTDVKKKLSEYGSAFRDEEKGDLDDSLSRLQAYKMSEIARMIRYREKMMAKKGRK